MENKRKNVYIVIFIITTIVASCGAVYFGLKFKEGKNELATEKELTETNNTKVEELQAKLNEQKDVPSETKEKIVEKAVRVAFDPSRIKNPATDVTYDSTIYGKSTSGIRMELLIESNGSFKIMRDQKNISVTGIKEKIVDALACFLGGGNSDIILLLTENGNVNYAGNVYYYNDSDIINFSKIEGVSDICRIESVYSKKNSGPSSARAIVVAIDSNGDCYDLCNNII